jgi:Holliday junction resolvase RusA-like endonuclease
MDRLTRALILKSHMNPKSHIARSTPGTYKWRTLHYRHKFRATLKCAIMVHDVDNFVVVLPSGQDHPDRHPVEASFTIHGAPLVQNGWKLAWKRNRHPVIYDPMQKQKIVLRANLRSGLFDLLQRSSFPIFAHRTLRVEVVFSIHNLHCKDIDNMMKFLFDAMQHVIYNNDSCIMTAIVNKIEAHEEDEESTFVKITTIDHNDSIYV